MKKVLTIVAMVLTVLGGSACTTSKKETDISKKMNDRKILVAYFSWSGNTRDAAKYIATEYEPCTVEAKKEKEAGERPTIKGLVEDMSQYDVIFVGVPVWWYTAPMPVFSFLGQYDLKDKTVIPFCTCYTAEYETLTDIVKATPESKHLEGLTIVTKEMDGKDMDKKHVQIDNWLTEIGF